MIIENGKIVECTNEELFQYYLSRGYDDIMSYRDFKWNCCDNGTVIKE